MATAFENLAPRVISDLVRDFELTAPQAAGIVGNLEAESGLRAINESGGGPGFGWAQWSFDRRTAFLNWCSACHFDSESYEANYGYLREELAGTFPKYNYSSVITKLKTTVTPEQAAQSFCNSYEKPNKALANMARRMASAKKALLLYQRAQAGLPAQVAIPKGSSPMDTTTPDTKPWYLSKGVIGGIISIALPLLSVAFPALKLVDANTATGVILKIVEVVGPVAGGLLAIVGRISATQPIAGSHAAQIGASSFARPTDPAGPSLFGLPIETVITEIPVLLSALDGMRTSFSPPPAPAGVGVGSGNNGTTPSHA